MLVLEVKNNRIVQISKFEGQKPMSNEVLVSDTDLQVMFLKKNKKKYVDVEALRKILEQVFDIHNGLLCKTKKQENTVARFTGMYILFKKGYGSYSRIAQVFNKDHATAIYGIKTIDNIKETGDKKWLPKIEQAIELFNEFEHE